MRVNSLHPRFDNIDWIVGKHRHSSGESACYQVAEYLGGDDVLKLLGGLRVNQESNTLISRLFKQSSCITLINTSNTICFNYFVNAVPYVSVLWSRLKLIMDELCFESLLRCDDEGGLGCACYEPTAEVVNSALVWEELRLSYLVRTKANIVLGDGEKEERTVATVEAKEASLTNGLFRQLDHTHGILLLVQLHHCLAVFSGVSDRYLDGAGDTTSYSRLQWCQRFEFLFRRHF